jgi:hypothetical protein
MQEQFPGHTAAWSMYGNTIHLLRGKRGQIGPFHQSLCGSRAMANGWHTMGIVSLLERLCLKCERSYNKTRETKPAKVERSKSWHLVTVYTDGSTFEDYFVSEGAAKRFVAESRKYSREHADSIYIRHIVSYTLTQEDVSACAECANKVSECVCIQDDVEESE